MRGRSTGGIGLLWLLLAALVAAGWSSGTAQTDYAIWSQRAVYETDRIGRVVRTTQISPQFSCKQLLQATDNANFVLVTQDSGIPPGPFRVYRMTRTGNITTVITLPMPWTSDVLLHPDGNGNYLIREQEWNGTTNFLRLNGSTLSTIANAVGVAVGGFTIDPRSGHLLVRGAVSGRAGYYTLDLQSRAVTTVLTNDDTGVASLHPIFDSDPASFVDLTQTGNQTEGVARFLGTTRTVITSLTLGRMKDIVRASDRDRPVAFHALTTFGNFTPTYVYHLSETGVPVSSSTLQLVNVFALGPQLLRIGGRNLVFRRTTNPNDGALDVMFPGEAGRPYVAAFSLAGASPGMPLPDGRTIPLNPDALTALTASGQAGRYFARTNGLLDATGRGSVAVTLNSLGSTISGTRLWVAVAILDPAAPHGIAHVTDPWVIVLQ